MYGKFFRPTLLKEIELTNYSEKAKKAKYEKHYSQTIRDLGRSYFYINGTKCSISPNASIEETKKKLTTSLSKISKLTIEASSELIHIILFKFNLNDCLFSLSNLMNNSKNICLDLFRQKENGDVFFSNLLGKSLYYLEIDDNGNPLTLHEFRVLILELPTGTCIPVEFITRFDFNEPVNHASLFREGNFKITPLKCYMATESDMLMKIKESCDLDTRPKLS